LLALENRGFGVVDSAFFSGAIEWHLDCVLFFVRLSGVCVVVYMSYQTA
jgi:hypothetical protein